MKNLDYYIYAFTHLRRAYVNGGAPHKPILLLSIIDCIDKGYINSERIYITPELVAYFKSNWSIWVQSAHLMNFSLPFYHMSNEPFWKLIKKMGYEIEMTNSRSIKSFNALNAAVDYALIDRELFLLLIQSKERLILKNSLIETYFSKVKPFTVSNLQYLDKITQNVLNDTTVQYQKRIEILRESENVEKFEEEMYLRSNVFKRQIPIIYNNTCCITGLKVYSDFNVSMIDACHIMPFCETHDDTVGNGIALCPNLHRAFDRGLITIDPNYKVVISKSFREESGCTHSIVQFENKEIYLPSNLAYYPKPENLIWHNEHVFR